MSEFDPVLCRELIEAKILELSNERAKIYELSTEKADSISQYDRKFARMILELKNDLHVEFEGLTIGKLTAGDRLIIAKGMVYKACMDKEASEGIYKACISNIEAIKAELNGLQSINRHLE